MSLVTEEHPPGLLYLPSSPQLHPTPISHHDRPELTTAASSPPPTQTMNQKSTTVTGTMCAVCGEVSTKEATFRKHYGVVCCEACKCFFRRTVQMSRDYKCRYDGRCTIGRCPENMKQVCQACRFSQCLRAGMKMECKSPLPLSLPPSRPPSLSSFLPPSFSHSLSSCDVVYAERIVFFLNSLQGYGAGLTSCSSDR